MPGQTRLQGRTVYYCTVCSLAYEEESTAKNCEDHCRAHPSCLVEIARKSVGSADKPSNGENDDARTV